MITVDKLKSIGIEPQKGIERCMNNEGFYLKLVQTVPDNEGFSALQDSLDKGDLDAAFEAAHALKGVLGNLELNTLYDPVVEITEHLRGREDMDYQPLLGVIMTERDRLKEQCD